MSASLSQPLSTFLIPSSERSDPEAVQSSLALARSELQRGEIRGALRHLRRAAEGADEAGSELRAVALARAAADLATEVGPSLAPSPVSIATAASAGQSDAQAALAQLLSSGRAVKVVVKRSARDESLYVVRRADDAAPALGTREAVMVLLEADDGFFAPPPAPPEGAPET
jgi:hypothetical protein